MSFADGQDDLLEPKKDAAERDLEQAALVLEDDNSVEADAEGEGENEASDAEASASASEDVDDEAATTEEAVL